MEGRKFEEVLQNEFDQDQEITIAASRDRHFRQITANVYHFIVTRGYLQLPSGVTINSEKSWYIWASKNFLSWSSLFFKRSVKNGPQSYKLTFRDALATLHFQINPCSGSGLTMENGHWRINKSLAKANSIFGDELARKKSACE